MGKVVWSKRGRQLWASLGSSPSARLSSMPPTHVPPVLQPSLLCLPNLSGALAVLLPTQLSHQPGRLNTWGQEAQEPGNGPPGFSCRFLKLLCTLAMLLPTSSTNLRVLPPSPHPQSSHCWSCFLKQGEDDTPASSEHRTVKSPNLNWMLPLRAEGPAPSFYKTIKHLRLLCQRYICFKKKKGALEFSSSLQ